MTDRKQSLIDLRDKVRAGEMGDTGPDRFTAIPKRGVGVYFDQNWRDAGNAYWHGDLNAAKALHDAVLPGWEWGVTDNEENPSGPAAFVARWGVDNGFEASSNTPARAWLLAILEALIAVESA